ncbi:restriction endonuclease subunit S [Jeotgalibacillus sp. JSM ZJ347]|uniref:restriction endonuclease subunit S n=1 Tax=Jeotgalibacillus sp. JSM ZJ347 TaxID=3342117 RepID=UPI0035A8F01D
MKSNIEKVNIKDSNLYVRKLKDISEFITKGTTPTTYGYKWESAGILFFKSDCIKDGKFVYGHYKHISKEAHNSLERSKVKKGDILMTITGDIGKVAILPDSIDEANINQHMARIRIIDEDIVSEYVYHWLNQKSVRNYFNVIKTGQAYPQISLKQVRETEIKIPEKNQQQKIASILSTWDKAIDLKEKLIALKKEQKKGLMQKLLTGEKRIAGFKGEWKKGTLRDLGVLKGGNGFPEKFQNEKVGEYPFFKVSDMNNENNEMYMLNANNYISNSIKTEIKGTVIPKGSIVFAKVGAALLLERKRILTKDSLIDNNMMALTTLKTIDPIFVYYLMLNTKISRYSNIGALPSLNSNDVYSVKCQYPVEYDEQKAISELLLLADTEIDLLEKELKEIKHQKKGLMQNLLTGKIRVKV